MVNINYYTHTPVKILKSHQEEEEELSSKSEEEEDPSHSRLVIVVEKAFCAVSDTANHNFLSQLVTHIAHKERIKVVLFYCYIFSFVFLLCFIWFITINNSF